MDEGTKNQLILDAECGRILRLEQAQTMAAYEQMRPSMLLRPRLSIDGDQWCALYGEDLQNGVAGFGASPSAAYAAFDRAWEAELPAIAKAEEE